MSLTTILILVSAFGFAALVAMLVCAVGGEC
jgi:hypothetical protein